MGCFADVFIAILIVTGRFLIYAPGFFPVGRQGGIKSGFPAQIRPADEPKAKLFRATKSN